MSAWIVHHPRSHRANARDTALNAPKLARLNARSRLRSLSIFKTQSVFHFMCSYPAVLDDMCLLPQILQTLTISVRCRSENLTTDQRECARLRGAYSRVRHIPGHAIVMDCRHANAGS
jgi:hypothetical protein